MNAATPDGNTRHSSCVRWSAAILAGVVVCGGCATTPKTQASPDPLEGPNRKIYRLNDAIDKGLLKPVANGYVRITPKPVRNSLSRFFDNLGYLNVILNDFLQGKVRDGFSDSGRFVVNSTVGVLGLFDPATRMGMKAHTEDFGQTLGTWGSGPGAYLMLPVLGPSTTRDAPGLALGYVTNVLFYLNSAVTLPLTILQGIDARARASDDLNIVDESAVDRYVFLREAYLQHRTFLIYDGNPPAPNFPDDPDAEPLPGAKASGAAPRPPLRDAGVSPD